MGLRSETITFLMFVILGMAISLIFDIFRAIRKVKKHNNGLVYFQDILFFIIVGFLIILTLIYFTEDTLRLYLIFSIILGVIIYISLIGNFVVNIFAKLFKMSGMIFAFIILPLSIYESNVKKCCNFISNFVKKCCNKFFNVVNYTYFKMKKVNFKTKSAKTKD